MHRFLHKYPTFMRNIMLNSRLHTFLGLFVFVEKLHNFVLFLQWYAMRCRGVFYAPRLIVK